MERMNHGTIPTAQSFPHNAVEKAKITRLEIRERAVTDLRSHNVKITLKEGGCFTTSIFQEDSVKKAEECLNSVPPAVHIHAPSVSQSFPARERTFSNLHAATKGNSTNTRGKSRTNFSNYTSSQHTPRDNQRGRSKLRGGTRGNSSSAVTRHEASRVELPEAKVSQVVAQHDCHLAWRLKLNIHRWTFASPMTQKILTKDPT